MQTRVSRTKTWWAAGAAVILLLLCLGTGFSQETTTENGLSTLVFETPEGMVNVYLPADLAMGDRITGTVVAQPSGDTEKQRAEFADRIAGYVVELNDTVKTTARGGSLEWVVPAGATALTLVLRDAKGTEVSRAQPPVVTDLGRLEALRAGVTDFKLPELGVVGHPVRVDGPFDGDLVTTGVAVGGKDTGLLAESPRAVFFEAGDDRIGSHPMLVKEREATIEGEFRTIGFLHDIPKTDLVKGETTELKTRVVGLEGLDQPVTLRLVNHTPDIVSVEGGDVEIIHIEPSDVGPEGTYTFSRKITGRQSGGFELALDLFNVEGKDSCEKIAAAIDSLRNEALEKDLEGDVLEDEADELADIGRLGEDYGPSQLDDMAAEAEKEAEKATGEKKAEMVKQAKAYRKAAEVLRKYASGDTEEQRLRAVKRIIQKMTDLRSKSMRLHKVAARLREISDEMDNKYRECLKKLGAN